MTRTGKIARLPLVVRNELGSRLRAGEPGLTLVDWLNSIPRVRDILAASFDARPVTVQNLSAWKQGGYLDWLRNQESRERPFQVRGQVDELITAEDVAPTLEAVQTLLGTTLERLRSEIAAKPQLSAEDQRELQDIDRELARMRRTDRYAALIKNWQAKHAAPSSTMSQTN